MVEQVALLAEGVDRNLLKEKTRTLVAKVALLAEGVDRNASLRTRKIAAFVALLAEGVDRNTVGLFRLLHALESPSSRRAWIEMSSFFVFFNWRPVALLAEGVDRNT